MAKPEGSTATYLEDLINPEVMADMISAKVEQKVKVVPYAKVDTTLQGQAGDTITIPKFTYIGDAVDVAEGEEIPTRALGVTTDNYTIKKIGIGGSLTDEAVLSGHGNPVGELTNQMAKSILSKTDFDAIDELYKATTTFTANDVFSYNSLVNAIDLYEEEVNCEKVVFIHPKQVTQLRLDENFLSADKYGNSIMVKGEIGMIANTRVVVSKKVKIENVYDATSDKAVDDDKTYFTLENGVYTEVETPDVDDIANYYEITTSYYLNPIVKLNEDTETEDESPAITVFLKRDTNVEKDRIVKRRMTEITGDKMYVVALTNESKVIIAKNLVEKAGV